MLALINSPIDGILILEVNVLSIHVEVVRDCTFDLNLVTSEAITLFPVVTLYEKLVANVEFALAFCIGAR